MNKLSSLLLHILLPKISHIPGQHDCRINLQIVNADTSQTGFIRIVETK